MSAAIPQLLAVGAMLTAGANLVVGSALPAYHDQLVVYKNPHPTNGAIKEAGTPTRPAREHPYGGGGTVTNYGQQAIDSRAARIRQRLGLGSNQITQGDSAMRGVANQVAERSATVVAQRRRGTNMHGRKVLLYHTKRKHFGGKLRYGKFNA